MDLYRIPYPWAPARLVVETAARDRAKRNGRNGQAVLSHGGIRGYGLERTKLAFGG